MSSAAFPVTPLGGRVSPPIARRLAVLRDVAPAPAHSAVAAMPSEVKDALERLGVIEMLGEPTAEGVPRRFQLTAFGSEVIAECAAWDDRARDWAAQSPSRERAYEHAVGFA